MYIHLAFNPQNRTFNFISYDFIFPFVFNFTHIHEILTIRTSYLIGCIIPHTAAHVTITEK